MPSDTDDVLEVPDDDSDSSSLSSYDSEEFRLIVRKGFARIVINAGSVGEFFVEELAKPRTTERLELGARELLWLAEATEKNMPAFFELQTHPTTNNALADAGVRLVVMKIVMRGVLLDITYSRDSYFATLQDNTEEIALEDTFVPDGKYDFLNF
ncbi:hypothetical protein GN244_ATG11689 [Phytophthora infestans]|uniref:Uncharacterized protein n=1 Tax=Phytophthora infestans TaxID=4787 RepID=A0A833SL44_PHYIN|nr:hypothetical protein GN244_ATG11689 [Phytophthora infestans]KAF4147538.1 hypothetical protein GN958_ATG03308 [Phytophthora infestans]